MNLPAKNNSASSLDIVIEAPAGVPVSVQVLECLLTLKVLELHNHVGIHFLHGFHELVHEVLLDGEFWTLLSKTQVQGILEVGLIVGTAVQDNRQRLLGADTCSSGIQSQLANLVGFSVSDLLHFHTCMCVTIRSDVTRAIKSEAVKLTYRNSNTIHAQVTETQDTGSVSDDANFGISAGPVLQHGADRLSLLDRDIQSFGSGVNVRVLQADISNGGSVHKRHEVADVVHQKTVEQVGILGLDGGQVHVLVDVGLARIDHLHGSGALSLQAFHGMGEETGEVLGNTLLGCK